MRKYLFSRTVTEWQASSFMVAGIALGKGEPWVWIGVLILAAVIEVCAGYPDEQ